MRLWRKTSLYCYQGNKQKIGGVGEWGTWEEEREEKGKRLWKGWRGEFLRWKKGRWQVVVDAVGGTVEIWAPALLFTPSLPCLRRLGLSCVGEFTVSVISSQTKLVSRFFRVRRILLSTTERKAAQIGNTEMTFPVSPFLFTCISYLPECLPPARLTLELLLLLFLAFFRDITASSGATFITLMQIFTSDSLIPSANFQLIS